MAASKTTTSQPAAAGGEQTIEQLQERYQSLNKKKIQADTNLEHAHKQLAALQKEAREKYGTDDVAELRKKLDQMTAENEAKRRQYQADLDRIEGELQAVDEKFASGGEAGNGEPA
jgi:chromosome segregation ATPase